MNLKFLKKLNWQLIKKTKIEVGSFCSTGSKKNFFTELQADK
jgi:hypothetical protein